MKKIKIVFRKNMAVIISAVALLAVTGCDKDDDYNDLQSPQPLAQIFKAAGDSAGMIGTINQFRSVLGDSLNTTPGKTSGRREVNWDGVPANLTNNNNFPLDFFNTTDPLGPNGRKRGLVYLNTGSPLRLDSSNFVEIDPAHANEFLPFSKKKTIISANTNTSEVIFKVPGTNVDAFVKGFAVIFSDVDLANSTSVEFFNGNKSLGVFAVPAKTAAAPFSFLGVYFPQEKVTRVKIIAGNNAIVAPVKDLTDGGTKDLVVYDDFFYNEPIQL